MSPVQKILKKHALRNTKVRVGVLECFEKSDVALSHADLENQLVDTDRVTLYRTLNSFLEKGLLHKIPDDTGVAKFAMCHENCNEHKHYDNHVHFKCEQCHKVQCFHEISIPEIKELQGYQIYSTDLLVQGMCKDCQAGMKT